MSLAMVAEKLKNRLNWFEIRLFGSIYGRNSLSINSLGYFASFLGIYMTILTPFLWKFSSFIQSVTSVKF